MHIEYKSGVYDGDVNSSKKPHGYGILLYRSGDKYEGYWQNAKMHGYGKFTFVEGGFAEGEYQFGYLNGQGTRVWENGEHYVGAWQNSQRHGYGVMHYSNGNSYKGMWKNDLRHGQGVMSYSNGKAYDGEWQNGKRYGRGRLMLVDGTIYTGVFDGKNASSVLCIKTSERLPLPGKIIDGEFIPDRLPPYNDGKKPTDKKVEYGSFSYNLGTYDVTYFEGKKVYYKNGLFSFSKENQDLLKEGLAPIGADGYSIELHHTTQQDDSPIVEILYTTHKGYYRTLHNPYQEYSGIDRSAFNNWKKRYWKNRLSEHLDKKA